MVLGERWSCESLSISLFSVIIDTVVERVVQDTNNKKNPKNFQLLKLCPVGKESIQNVTKRDRSTSQGAARAARWTPYGQLLSTHQLQAYALIKQFLNIRTHQLFIFRSGHARTSIREEVEPRVWGRSLDAHRKAPMWHNSAVQVQKRFKSAKYRCGNISFI